MAEQQADKKPEATITGARIALVGTVVAAIIGATATITVALLQRKAPAPTTAPTTSQFWRQKVFDESALEGDDGVRKVLIDHYGLPAEQIRGVDCPAGREVRAGTEFTCTVQVGGDAPGKREVDITVREDSGEYEVSVPRER